METMEIGWKEMTKNRGGKKRMSEERRKLSNGVLKEKDFPK
jgi:hypothetical protein